MICHVMAKTPVVHLTVTNLRECNMLQMKQQVLLAHHMLFVGQALGMLMQLAFTCSCV